MVASRPGDGQTGGMQGYDDLAGKLDAVAEELGSRAFDLLRAAVRDGGEEAAAAAKAEERVLNRARRSIEKAAGLLRGADPSEGDG